MNRYEVIFVIRPDASEETISKATEKAQEQVTRNGGIVLGLENWGRKRFSFDIKHLGEGIYIKMDFEAPGDVVDKLSRHFALSEEIIRHQTIRQLKKRTTAS